MSAALFFLVAGPAAAFLVQTFEGFSGPVQQTWQPNADGIEFRLHSAGSDDMDPATTHRLLRESFATWQAVPGAAVRFVDRGVSSSLRPAQNDGNNLIFFDETGSYLSAPRGTGIIAVTRLNGDLFSGRINDADIIFNGRDFRFSAEPAAGRVHLKDVAVHEIGHLLGLDHTPLDGPAGIRPTMNPFNRGDGPGEATSLEADDVAGISFLYPAASAPTAARLEGKVSDAEGTPLFGVAVTAQSLDGTGDVGTVTGAFSKTSAPGDYILHGLAPGRYRLQISPIQGSIDEDNFGGIFTDFAVDFPNEYFGNTSQAALSQVIEVEAGEARLDLDFVTGFRRPGFPVVEPVIEPSNTPDTTGPYLVRFRLQGATRAALLYRGEPDATIKRAALTPDTDGVFVGQIPGQATGVEVSYQVEAVDSQDRRTVYPEENLWRSFEVFAPSGDDLVLIAAKGDGALSIIDTGTRREVSRLALGDEPIQVLLAPGSDRLFVSNLGSNEVYVVDTATLQTRQRIAVGAQPLDMALSPDGATLYVSNSDESSVNIIDVASGAVRRLELPLERAYGVAAAAGRLFVTDINADQVLALDEDGGIVARLEIAEGPRSLARTPTGDKLYATSFSGDLLSVIDPLTPRVLRRVRLPVAGTFAVAVSPDGLKVYITSHTDGIVVVLDAVADTVLAEVPVGENPRAVAFSPDGSQVYVTSAGSDELHILDAQTDRVLRRFSSIGEPRGLAVIPSPAPPTVVSVQAPTPRAFALQAPYPNPFNAAVQIAYDLPSPAGRVSLAVHDALGRPLRRLVQGRQAAGRYLKTWDGRTDAGHPAASGTYFIVLETPWGKETRKATLLR